MEFEIGACSEFSVGNKTTPSLLLLPSTSDEEEREAATSQVTDDR
jgi:hypothetical protein